MYGLLLGAAVVGLIVDQVFLESGATGPNAAAAESLLVPSTPAQSQALIAEMNKSAATLDDQNSVAQRLVRFATEHRYDLPQVDNAFAPSEAWVAQPPDEAAKAPKVAELFTAQHKLTAVMTTSQGGIAMVRRAVANESTAQQQALRTGDVMDGFTLTQVSSDAATFESGAVKVTLKLELPEGHRGVTSGNAPAAAPVPATLPAIGR